MADIGSAFMSFARRARVLLKHASRCFPLAIAALAMASSESAAAGSAWIKFCDNRAVRQAPARKVCLTYHERIQPATASIIVAAALAQIDGESPKSLLVFVQNAALPKGVNRAAGLRAAVYDKVQWDKAARKEKIDESALKPFALKFVQCTQAGCTGRAELNGARVVEMIEGAGLMILALSEAGRPIGFPVPLAGFGEAVMGEPMALASYDTNPQ